jgi:redox-sensitive bicupin YhaK (pirin superfamily)
MTTMHRTIESRTVLQPRQAARGFVEATVFHGGPVVLDPFLALTDFHMTQPTFAPLPHAGFSAVTYMFRDGVGAFRNRDSLGDQSLIEPGALHWTQAGSGMMHEEIPVEPGVDCHGLQLFVNLRSDHKLAAPRAFHVSAAAVPVVHASPGVTARVVVGRLGEVSSPIIGLLTEVQLLDVDLAASADVELPVEPSHRVVVLVVEGSVVIDGVTLPKHAVASLAAGPPTLAMSAGAAGATVLVLAGAPLGEPVVFGGPFCMNSQLEVDAARARFSAGAMGSLARSF